MVSSSISRRHTTTTISLLFIIPFLIKPKAAAATFLSPAFYSGRKAKSLSHLTFISQSFSHTSSSSKTTTFKMAHMDSPSAQRNKGPIWSILSKVLSDRVSLLSTDENKNDDSTHSLEVLEIAAGVGVHTIHFTSQLLLETSNNQKISVKWYPSDPDETCLNSIESRVSSCTDPNMKESIHVPPLPLMLGKDGILENSNMNNGDSDISCNSIIMDEQMDLITCINMIHISPWEATIGLFKVASQKLKKGGVLYCYGPYKENGTAVQSNL